MLTDLDTESCRLCFARLHKAAGDCLCAKFLWLLLWLDSDCYGDEFFGSINDSFVYCPKRKLCDEFCSPRWIPRLTEL